DRFEPHFPHVRLLHARPQAPSEDLGSEARTEDGELSAHGLPRQRADLFDERLLVRVLYVVSAPDDHDPRVFGEIGSGFAGDRVPYAYARARGGDRRRSDAEGLGRIRSNEEDRLHPGSLRCVEGWSRLSRARSTWRAPSR